VFATGPAGGGERRARARDALGWVLTGATGRPCRVVPYESYSALLDNLWSIAFCWLPPAIYVRATTRNVSLLCALGRSRSASYRGAIFTRADGPHETLASLEGKRIAWVDRDSCSGHLFPRLFLHRSGYRPGALFADQLYAGSHEEVVRAVREGRAEVGATYVHVDPRDETTVVGSAWHGAGVPMRVLGLTPPIPSDVIAIGPDAANDEIARVSDALDALTKSDSGRGLMMGFFGTPELADVEVRTYDAVRDALATTLDL